jgi:hypothetical protein
MAEVTWPVRDWTIYDRIEQKTAHLYNFAAYCHQLQPHEARPLNYQPLA